MADSASREAPFARLTMLPTVAGLETPAIRPPLT